MDGIKRAEELIEQERKFKTGFLDLGGLGLIDIPESLKTLDHLESLNMGIGYLDADGIYCDSINKLDKNEIISLEKLSGLPCLKTLFLRGLPMRSLAGIEKFTILETLDCCDTQISDLSPLSKLPSLQRLDCSGTEISDLSPLSKLPSLQRLDCSFTQISDLSPLSKLPSLQRLGCSFTQISDLSPLSKLPSLQRLDCFGTQISDLSPLSKLPSLQELNCSHTEISDLSPLSKLPSLQRLGCSFTQISDLIPLSKLPSLQELDCSGTQISDLSLLSKLPLLQSFNCSSTGVIDLSPLTELQRITNLRANKCKLSDFPKQFLNHPILTILNLFDVRIPGIPQEVLSENYYDNCLQKLRDHMADLSAGAEEVRDVKVIVLGNGRVGKTQLCRRLRGDGFDESVPSTHGITIDRVEPSGEDGPILNLWDFGGQDIYHGTHALFMATRAVFVVVWHPDFEQNEEIIQGGHRFRNYALPYWVEYVRNLGGPASPLILVQARCDRPEDEIASPPVDPDQLDFTYVKVCCYSAKKDRGRGALDDYIEQAVEYLRQREGIAEIGKGRMAVLRQLQEWRKRDAALPLEQREHRTLTIDQFRALCEQQPGVSTAGSLLDYLHQIGAVFYRKDLFNGHIILDQTWALEAIYAVFDRQQSYRQLCLQHGRFTRSLLDVLVWQDYTEEAQKLFLSLMESCGVCFVHKPADERRSVDAEYIAPDLLPDKTDVSEKLAGRWAEAEPATEVCYSYRFLHSGIIRSLLTRIGRHAQTAAVYWKYGAWLYDTAGNARAVIEQQMQDSCRGRIVLRLQNDRSGTLLQWLRTQLEDLNKTNTAGQPAIEIDGQTVLPLASESKRQKTIDVERHAADTSCSSGEATAGDASKSPRFGMPSRNADSSPRIFVSYAWDDPEPAEKRREQVVNQLCQAMAEQGVEIIRDKTHLKLGESISAFMNEIACGDFIVAVISDKYLRSTYCMHELFQIYRNCADNAERFSSKVIPLILPDAGLDSLGTLIKYVTFWKAQKDTLTPQLQEIGPDYLDEVTIREYRMICEFGHNVLPILHMIKDRMIPRDLDRMAEDGFQEILQLTGLTE